MEKIVLETLNGGENLQDNLTHGLWCVKCGFLNDVIKQGNNAFFIQNGNSVCKKHYRKNIDIKNIIDWVKLNIFNICTNCGGKLYHWSMQRWDCLKCGEKYYTGM